MSDIQQLSRTKNPSTKSPAPVQKSAVPETPEAVTPADMQSLTPSRIKYLQRTIGNHALGKIMGQTQAKPLSAHTMSLRIQRALPAAGDYTPISDTVGTAVDEYNKLAKPTTAPEYNNVFKAMQKVERAVYTWFDTFTTTNQNFGDNVNAAKMNDLLSKLEVEHRAMIDSSKNLTEVLPFDTTGLTGTELTAMKTLWQDIVNKRGKIQLVGGDDFNKKTLSHLGRILSTPTGRQMLGFLNSPPPKGYKPGEKPELTNIYIGEALAQLPDTVKNASPELEDRNRAEAQPLNIDEDNGRSVESMTAVKSSTFWFKPKKSDYPTIDPTNIAGIRDALMSGKKGFVYNKRKYKFNKNRTGAFVTNVEHASLHPAKGSGNQIQSPTWVTLAHELGHTVNMRGGGTTLKATELSSLGGKGADAEKWDNPEELLNIENIENAVRKEAGLTERFGHRPPDWLLKIAPKVRSQLLKPLNELYKLDQKKYNFNDNKKWEAAYKLVNTMKAQIAVDAEALDDVKAEVKKYIDEDVDDSTELQLHTKAITLYNAALIEIDKLLSG